MDGFRIGIDLFSQGLGKTLAVGTQFSEINGLGMGLDSPRFSEVAGISTSVTNNPNLTFLTLASLLSALLLYYLYLFVNKNSLKQHEKPTN